QGSRGRDRRPAPPEAPRRARRSTRRPPTRTGRRRSGDAIPALRRTAILNHPTATMVGDGRLHRVADLLRRVDPRRRFRVPGGARARSPRVVPGSDSRSAHEAADTATDLALVVALA